MKNVVDNKFLIPFTLLRVSIDELLINSFWSHRKYEINEH